MGKYASSPPKLRSSKLPNNAELCQKRYIASNKNSPMDNLAANCSSSTPQCSAPRRLVLSLNALVVTKTVGSDLFIIALKRSEILTRFGELALLHTLTNIPVNESTLAVHEVELVRESRPCLANGGGVGQHADGAVDSGEITVGNHLRWLVADTNLETSGAPVDELDGALSLEVSNGGVGVLGDNVTTVQQAGSHVLAVARIALDHLVVRLEAGVGDLHDRVGLVCGLGGGDDGRVGDEREVDTGVGDQVGLELVQVNVQGAVESKRGSDGGDN
jgi:hypothetical protein